MSNSGLVNYKLLTSHYGYPTGQNGRNGVKIDKIFLHHMAGNLTVETCGNVFKTREASAHYGIDGKGRVGQYVLEENAAWHCANKAYSLRSIAIELANDGGASTDWHVSDKTIAKAIELIVDICKRNGIKKLNYTGDLSGNLCMHCWTASTACPGGYLKTKFKYIADEVNKRLAVSNAVNAGTDAATSVKEIYRVRKTWNDAKSQIGAYSDLTNAKKACDKNPGYSVFDKNGKKLYTSSTIVAEKRYLQITSYRNAYTDVKKTKLVMQVPKGSKVYQTKRDGKWLYIESIKGWICETDSKIGMCVKVIKDPSKKYTTQDKMNIRTLPGTDASKTGSLAKGKSFTGRDIISNWTYYVGKGWICIKQGSEIYLK